MIKSVVWFLVAVILASYASAACTTASTPDLKVNDRFNLAEGSRFSQSVEDKNNLKSNFIFTELEGSMPNFNMTKDGKMSFTPSQNDTGFHKLMIVAYTDQDCFDSEIVNFIVYDKPDLVINPEEDSLDTAEGKGVNFKVEIIDEDSGDKHNISWYENNELAGTGSSYIFLPDHSQSGIHTISVKVSDSRKLTNGHSWKVTVQNANRRPYLTRDIPDVVLFVNDVFQPYNLKDYFKDSDSDPLIFSYKKVKPDPEEIHYITNFNINVENELVDIETYAKSGIQYIKYVATDDSGLSVESNKVRIDALEVSRLLTSKYCGDEFCSAAEGCSICAEDCGSCEISCNPNWDCDDWSICKLSGIQTRLCSDLNQCQKNEKRPLEVQKCEYKPTCEDGVKNQDETDIDCGGSCLVCPSCSDNIKNQGEENIDCGGPCEQCDSCIDNVQNQDETDIDCGGICPSCGTGRQCRTSFDCFDFICEEGFCHPGSCDDGIKNQGEENIDCGGPCEQCETCSDGAKNQDETDIDCGGICGACPTCHDKIKNQDEKLIDCGGECNNCTIFDQIKNLEFLEFFLIILGLMLFVVLTLKFIPSSNFYMTVKNRGILSFLENESYLNVVINLNRISRIFRRKGYKGDAENAIDKLKNADHDKENVKNAVLSFFKSVLSIPQEPSYREIYESISKSSKPLFVQKLLAILLSKFWFLINESYSFEGELPRFKIIALKILNELKKDL
uniref:Extracellular matrix Teneurin-1-related protein n=1 Tax=uncultured marine group II/III euryarchaeote KM3_83_G03 TaxID=1456522 RepID=A0A075HY05_9EURY|nr:extracellular matrix Teneurin-1-related protein [uncultured marine group II/III euryarchaeote KM3_83_G03]